MSDLVKTGKEIFNEIIDAKFDKKYELLHKLIDQKFLVLPQGLDKLEEMLVERFPDCENRIHDVFARFKQDIGLVNTEGKKKENGI